MTKKEIETTKKWIERTYKNINYYDTQNMKICKKYEIGRFLGIVGLAEELKIDTTKIIPFEEIARLGNEYCDERNEEF